MSKNEALARLIFSIIFLAVSIYICITAPEHIYFSPAVAMTLNYLFTSAMTVYFLWSLLIYWRLRHETH